MPVSCTAQPLVPSPEKRQFDFSATAGAAAVSAVESSSSSSLPEPEHNYDVTVAAVPSLSSSLEPEEHNYNVYDNTNNHHNNNADYYRTNDTSDDYDNMMVRSNESNDNFEVFEDKDDDSDEVAHVAAFRRQQQQYRLHQEQLKKEQQLQEQERLRQMQQQEKELQRNAEELDTPESPSSYLSPSSENDDRIASTDTATSAVELIAVERWTVESTTPASLTITSGVKYTEEIEHNRYHQPILDYQQHGRQLGYPNQDPCPIRQIQVTGDDHFHQNGSNISTSSSNQNNSWMVDANNPGLSTACHLVKDIYEQITLHDSPAVNECHTIREYSQLQQPSLTPRATVTSSTLVTPKKPTSTPVNIASKASSQRHDATTITNVVQQHHNNHRQTTTRSERSSFDTEDTNSNPSQPTAITVVGVAGAFGAIAGSSTSSGIQDCAHAHSFFRHLQNQPQSKMGHLALGTLCSWTLEQLQGTAPVIPQRENHTMMKIHQHIKSQQQQQQITVSSSPSSRPMNIADLNTTRSTMIPSNKSSSNAGRWNLKSYWKKKKKSSEVDEQHHHTSTANDVVKSPSALVVSIPNDFNMDEEHAADDDRFDQQEPHQQHDDAGTRYPEAGKSPKSSFPAVAPSPRLQMFGSEYARFLSSSALAPKIRSPRLPSKSASSRYGPFSTASSRRTVTGYNSGNISAGIQQIMSSSSFGSIRSKNCRSKNLSWNLEDQDNAILTGAIVDICITNGADTPPPKGYYRISQTVDGEEFRALRAGGSKSASPRKKSSTYINVKKEPNWHRAAQRPCVTALTVIFPDRQEFVPPGFCVVREHRRCPAHQQHHPNTKAGVTTSGTASLSGGSTSKQESDTTFKDQPANFNSGMPDGERVFLCFRRSREGNPITGILPLQPAYNEAIPDGYTVLERSPRNFVASINPKNGSPVFLAYRQRLANLEPLRPLPLLLSVPTPLADEENDHPSLSGGRQQQQSKTAKPKLSAYYCTGGTVVEADVGRYHIMDRSTHDLLSPSSVANRLSLIELSRRKSMPQLASEYESIIPMTERKKSTPTKQGMSTTSVYPSPSNTPGKHSGHDSVASSTDRSNPNVSFATNSSMAEYPNNPNSSFSSTTSSKTSFEGEDGADTPSIILSSFPSSNNHAEGYYQKLYDPELKLNHDALNFIPVVETATHPARLKPQRHLRARTALLTPILTACYQRHGGAALKAVEGLTKIITETNFFADDVDSEEQRASSRLTLLDLAVQVVCDVATCGTQETTFGTCVEFVENAVQYSQGHLNTRSIGYILRFYLFVFYFGASIPANTAFPNATWITPGADLARYDGIIPILFDPRTNSNNRSCYLPGGAPQSAALAFKELISLSINRLQRVCLSISDVRVMPKEEGIEMESTNKFMGGIISSLVDGAVYRVDVANFTQMAIHQIHRSGGSELFWHDMITSCGTGLFGKDPELSQEVQNMFVTTFAIIANLVKVASGKIRTNTVTFEMRPRDISSKLLSLELILHFLEMYHEEHGPWLDLEHSEQHRGIVTCVETMVFSMRRLVVPCILANTRAGLEDPQVFHRCMQIMSFLWSTPMYRDRMKGEMGMLIEHFALRILRLGPQYHQTRPVHHKVSEIDDLSCPLLLQQLDLLKQVKHWFSVDPKVTIEMYLNFDTDITSQVEGPIPLLPGTQWKVFQRICASLCNLAEQCGELIGEQIRQSQSIHPETTKIKIPGFADISSETQAADSKEAKVAEMKSIREGARRLRKAALDCIVQILKCLARTAAKATGKEFYTLVASWSGSDNDPDKFDVDKLSAASQRRHRTSEREGGPGSVLNFWRNEMASRRKVTKPMTYNFENQTGLLNSVTRETAFDIARKKSIKKAVEYLIACNALTPSPRDIASFLRVHKDQLDQGALGYYLGESGVDGQENEYWNLIRFSYVRAISFDGMKVEEALRHFLTNCGFLLPGEAQKVDRIMSTFAQCYWEDNAGDTKNCPFHDQDTVYLLSFAIIMLNTDLHKTAAPPSNSRNSKNARKRITKQEFLKNLSGVEGSEELKREYLSVVYDSIEANPIIMVHDELGSQSHAVPTEGRERMLKSMLCNVRSADALLRGLSVYDVKWASMQDFSSSLEYEGAEALADLAQSCFSEAWHQFHGVVNTALETAHLDPQGIEPCVDLLKYALVVTICLDLPMERAAFLSQLGRFKVFEGSRNSSVGHWVPDAEQGRQLLLQGNPAFDRAIAGPLDEESKLKALSQVHEATQDLRYALKEDIHVKEEMTRATSHIAEGEFLLNDPGRSFVRMGDLRKKSKKGRFTEYRFFLFSDVLIYAKQATTSGSSSNDKDRIQQGSFAENIAAETDKETGKGEYKIHEELPLHLMKVVDWFPPSTNKEVMKKAFHVHHPRKSFLVFCSSTEERVAWVSDIRAAINREIQHKVEMAAARMAASEVPNMVTSMIASSMHPTDVP